MIRVQKILYATDFSSYSNQAYFHAVALAENLLSDAPLMGRAAVQSYARAKAYAPDGDEGKLIEIVSRPK